MKRSRLLSALLACALLSGCGSPAADPQPEPSVSLGTVAYVPLDDRPDNVERVVYLAESLGYQLLMPDADLYQTKLDGQPLNENGTQYGDMAALYDWVLAQEETGCDRYILSLDQLLSGGLVNSRHTAGAMTVALSDGRTMTDRELLDSLLTALAADGDNQVWLLDTVMRLAPTYGYDGLALEEYNALRSYGMEARPALSGSALTVENILADYQLGRSGAPLAPADFGAAAAQVDDYLAARERKLTLSDQMLQTVGQAGFQHFRVLTGVDDSSAEDSIQKNEIAYLRGLLRQGDALLSGVDDLAFKAVAKLYLEETGFAGASASVLYYGGTEDAPACDYDAQPLQDIVSEHLAFFGLAQTDASPDLQVLVLTQPADEGQKVSYYQALIDRLNQNERDGLPTILIDAANNTYGTAFHDALVKQANLGYLLSYAGFLDMAIVTGTALSHGAARYAWLTNGGGAGADDLANIAFQQSLTESVVLDFCYRNTVRDDLSAYVREQGGDPNNFYAPAIDTEDLRRQLNDRMADSARSVLKNLSRSNLLVSLDAAAENGGLAGWGTVSLSDWSFPWQRVFEVRMTISPAPLTQPHRQILWFRL